MYLFASLRGWYTGEVSIDVRSSINDIVVIVQ